MKKEKNTNMYFLEYNCFSRFFYKTKINGFVNSVYKPKDLNYSKNNLVDDKLDIHQGIY